MKLEMAMPMWRLAPQGAGGAVRSVWVGGKGEGGEGSTPGRGSVDILASVRARRALATTTLAFAFEARRMSQKKRPPSAWRNSDHPLSEGQSTHTSFCKVDCNGFACPP